MTELRLRFDQTLGHAASPAPADLAEGFSGQGSPLSLHADPLFSSLPPQVQAHGLLADWSQWATWLHGAWVDAVLLLQWFFVLYFIVLNGGYLVRNVVSLFGLFRHLREHGDAFLPQSYSNYEPPISIIVPLRDEEATIAARVRALQQLDYPEFEIILVNDGSRDKSMDVLLREFSLTPFPEAYRDRLQSRRVRTVYASALDPALRLVDKDGGGRADALNAGINCARYPLFCGVDADTILQRDALRRMARPYLEHETTVASCVTMRPANGAIVHAGLLGKVGLARNLLALFQTVESLRAFLFGRFGWSPLNALLVFAPTFGVFRREAVIGAGGYRGGVPEENMDLVVRLHHFLLQPGKSYRVDFVPDPVCWSAVPENAQILRDKRIHFQARLSEGLMSNLAFLLRGREGAARLPHLAFMLLFDLLGPLFEVAGYLVMTLLWAIGAISLQAFGAFLLVAIGLGILLSLSGVLLEEMSYRLYPGLINLLKLLLAAVLENFGYRQLAAFWRLRGLLHWMLRDRGKWGSINWKTA